MGDETAVLTEGGFVVLEHWLWLTTRKGLGARSVDLVLRHFGSPKAVYEAADYRAVEGLRAYAL